MLKNISGLSVALGWLTEYLDHCGPGTSGLACLTGLPHCPTGRCSGGVCSPDTNG